MTTRALVFSDIRPGMILQFTPRAGKARVRVVVDHTTSYDNGLAFIFGMRCDSSGHVKRSARLHTYLVRADSPFVHTSTEEVTTRDVAGQT